MDTPRNTVKMILRPQVKLQTFPQLYKGAISCGLTTFNKEGIRGLYAGKRGGHGTMGPY
jgi:hypothetical protein